MTAQTKKTKRTLIIDNYDSFTYNIVQYIEELDGNAMVFHNDEITVKEIEMLRPTHIIISPGPGTPTEKKDIGICREIIKELAGTVPILGICLGHQAIALAAGADILHAPEVMHGKTSLIRHTGASPLFRNIPEVFEAMRYHSLIVDATTLPPEFKVTAITLPDTDADVDVDAADSADIATATTSKKASAAICMAIENQTLGLYGVQFHPESIATPIGRDLMENFMRIRITHGIPLRGYIARGTSNAHSTNNARGVNNGQSIARGANRGQSAANGQSATHAQNASHAKGTGAMFRKHAGLARGLSSPTNRPAVGNQKSAQPGPISTRKKLHEIALNLLGRLSRRAGKSTAGDNRGGRAGQSAAKKR